MRELIPLIGSINDRGTDPITAALSSKDQLFENCLFYPIENKWTGKRTLYIERRPGVPASGTDDADFVSINGFYHWRALGTTCRYGRITSGPPATYGFKPIDSTGSNTVQGVGLNNIFHVSEGKNSAGTYAVFYIAAGTSNTYTTVYMWADGDAADTHITVPSGSCGHLAHIDGYVFVANTNGRIYNSTLNDPTTGYTDFIGADIHPDILVTVYKYKNYLLAFGTNSLEWYKIGDQPTGSPLQRIPELFTRIGIFKEPSAAGFWSSLSGIGVPIVDGNNTIFWVGQSEDGLSVYTMDNMQVKKISTAEVDKQLGAFYGKIRYVEIGKRKIVLVPTYSENADFRYLCYDIELDFWSIWDTTGFNMSTWTNTTNGQGLIAATSNDYYEWNPGDTVPYKDISADITRTIRTSPLNFDTNNLKDIPRLSIIGDKQAATSNISIRWSKDDYQNWSTAKTIDMGSSNPTTYAVGTARNIAFELSDTVENPQRIQSLEIEYNIHD
jgi:hypothetical protein